MKKTLLIVMAVAGLGLAGCVAVPYDPYYGPAYGPAPVVVEPSISFGYSGYYGRGYYGHRHWR